MNRTPDQALPKQVKQFFLTHSDRQHPAEEVLTPFNIIKSGDWYCEQFFNHSGSLEDQTLTTVQNGVVQGPLNSLMELRLNAKKHS